MDAVRGAKSRLTALPSAKRNTKTPKRICKVKHSATKPGASRAANKRTETIVRNVHAFFSHQRDVLVQGSKCTCFCCKRVKSAAEPVLPLPFAATELATGIKKKTVYRVLKKLKGQAGSQTNSFLRPRDAIPGGQWLHTILSNGFLRPELLYWHHLVRVAGKDPYGVAVERLECVLETTGFVLQPWNDQLVPIEKRALVDARTRYLDAIESARKESTVVYVDARWMRGGRLLRDPRPGGRCELLMFAGSADALPNPLFNLGRHPTVSDAEHAFLAWIGQLSRVLPARSTLVFVDTPWLAVPAEQVPSEATPKAAILRWLSERAQSPNKDATRWELLELVKRHHGCDIKSRLQTVAEELGHRVLLVPPNVADLNPVSSIWPILERALTSVELTERATVAAGGSRETAVRKQGLSCGVSVWQELVSLVPSLEKGYRAFDSSMATLLASLPPNTNPYRDDLLLPRA